MLLGLALGPAIVGLARALLEAVIELEGPSSFMSLDTGIFSFVAGFGFFLLTYVFLPRPTRAYVWAHEITHVLFARLHGARVKDMSVRREEGSVVLSRTHLLTLLAPYFFPLHTVLLTLLLLALSPLIPPERIRIPGFALLGVFWGFHACFTINSMLQHQTDLERSGYVFAYALIVFLNLVILAVGFLVVTSFPLRTFLLLWLDQTTEAYAMFWHVAGRNLRRLRQWL